MYVIVKSAVQIIYFTYLYHSYHLDIATFYSPPVIYYNKLKVRFGIKYQQCCITEPEMQRKKMKDNKTDYKMGLYWLY